MKITTFLNQKGGVGKTSCCHHLAGALAMRGRRVLLVDNDPQASLTQGLLGPVVAEGLTPSQTIAAVYDGTAWPQSLARTTNVGGVALLAGSWKLADFNVPVERGAVHELVSLCRFLREDLDPAANDSTSSYDHVLIDCPPNLQACAWAAIVASDALFVPLQAEDYGAQGLAPVLQFVEEIGRSPGVRFDRWNLLVTMFDGRPALPRLFLNELRESYGTDLCDVVIPRSIDYPEAVMRRLPVSHHKPRSKAAAAVDLLADEFERRIGFTVQPAAVKGGVA